MSEALDYFDCGQCGHIGMVSELKEHPFRPMPEDIGFCPECGVEVEDLITRDNVAELLVAYGEDADEGLKEIEARLPSGDAQ